MKTYQFLFFLLVLCSCASEKKPKFNKEKVCSNESIQYMKHPMNAGRVYNTSPVLATTMSNTQRSMQLCYEDFKERSGVEEFNTCLVVGINEYGLVDFYNFSSREAKLDKKFVECANAVTAGVNFASYGWNSIIVQSYQFYNQ